MSLPDLKLQGIEAEPPQFRIFKLPAPPPLQALKRTASLFVMCSQVLLEQRLDRLLGRDSASRRSERLQRHLLQQGDATIHTARQLAMRLDVVDLDIAGALVRLQGSSPPQPLEDVLERIEQAVGVPLEQAFEALDPEPVESNCLSCVYQATLRNDFYTTLDTPDSGSRQVTIRVRKPDVLSRLNTERLAIEAIFQLLSPFFSRDTRTVVRNLLRELPQMLEEGLDYTRSKRLMRMLYDSIKEHKVKKWGVAWPYVDLCSDSVIIIERVDGIALGELIAMRDTGDTQGLQRLTSQDVKLSKVAQRVLNMGWWNFFENYFFCELVNLHNIIVDPQGRLIMTDVVEVGVVSGHEQRLLTSFYSNLSSHNVTDASSNIIELLSPLPYINTYEFQKKLEACLLNKLVAMENKGTMWWERTTLDLWIDVFEMLREFDISLRLNTCRIFQSINSHEYIAAQLWPELRVLREYRRYEVKSDERQGNRLRKQLRKQRSRPPKGDALAALLDGSQTITRFSRWFNNTVESAPLTYLQFTKKSAYSLATALSTLRVLIQFTLVLVLFVAIVRGVDSGEFMPRQATELVLRHPLYMLIVFGMTMLTIRRILIRLEDIEI